MRIRILAAALLAGVVGAACGVVISERLRDRTPVRIGLLHSLTGPTSISETSLVEAELMAIDEVNASGGINGRKVVPVLADGRSDADSFSAAAEKLFTADAVAAIFGCFTSASRRSTIPVVERHQGLLFYPAQYEGLESSAHVFYTGTTANQQIIPAVKWMLDNRGQRFFLVGSEDVFPRAAHAIVADELQYLGGELVGHAFIPIGSQDVEVAIEQIQASKPQVILSTLIGDTNVSFFEQLRAAGVKPSATPTVLFNVAENELRRLDPMTMAGDYVVQNYFQSVPSKANDDFVRRFRASYGVDRVTDAPIVAAYTAIWLWAHAAGVAQTTDPAVIRASLRANEFAGPEGTIHVDRKNQHTWHVPRIGTIRPNGQIDILWQSEALVHPVPYPIYRTRRGWQSMLDDLYAAWGNRWSPPIQEAGKQ